MPIRSPFSGRGQPGSKSGAYCIIDSGEFDEELVALARIYLWVRHKGERSRYLSRAAAFAPIMEITEHPIWR